MDFAELVGILIRIALGGVLLWAGVAKLQDRTWLLFGMTSELPYWILVLLPFVECSLGVLLIAQAYVKVTTVGAFLLFSMFALAVARELRQPEPQPCNCFGGSSDQPVNSWTLVRNLALMVLAVAGLILG